MKLQLLIPRYKEQFAEIKPLLDSVAIQQNINFDDLGVIVCSDGDEPFHDLAQLHDYPFEVQFHVEPHRGVSATRNACLDKATADYVMFCDIDDMFMNVFGLYVVFDQMNQGFDSMTSCFVEETRHPETKQPVYVNREMDSTFVHGKVHRRQYLIEQNLRWDEHLTIHEDSYFNILAQSCSNNVKYCPIPFYLWKWRDQSVCRHDPKYILKTYNNMLDSNTALIAELNRRDIKPKASFYCGMMVFDAYYTMNKPEWRDQENQEYRANVERRFVKYMTDHQAIWSGISDTEKMAISNAVRGRSVMEGMQMEDRTIMQWLDEIKENYGD